MGTNHNICEGMYSCYDADKDWTDIYLLVDVLATAVTVSLAVKLDNNSYLTVEVTQGINHSEKSIPVHGLDLGLCG